MTSSSAAARSCAIGWAELHCRQTTRSVTAQLQLIQATKMEVVQARWRGAVATRSATLSKPSHGPGPLDRAAAQHDPTTRVVMRDIGRPYSVPDKIVAACLGVSGMNQPSRLASRTSNALVPPGPPLAGCPERSQVRVQEDLRQPARRPRDANKIEQALIQSDRQRRSRDAPTGNV